MAVDQVQFIAEPLVISLKVQINIYPISTSQVAGCGHVVKDKVRKKISQKWSEVKLGKTMLRQSARGNNIT